MDRIALLHLINGLSDSSIHSIVEHLVERLDQQCYEWHVGGLTGVSDGRAGFERLQAHVVDFSDGQTTRESTAKKIRNYIAVHQIEIVHTHGPRTRLAAARALAGKQRAVHLATMHSLFASRDRRLGWLYALLDRYTIYLPDHVVAVSQRMRRQIIALPGISARRVTAIQNAIDCEFYYAPDQRDACRSEFGLSQESQVIGFTGRIERVKRLDLLLEGFSQALTCHPQARLMIAGEGQERARLEVLAAGLGVSQYVIWTGFRRDIPRLLAAMDIYVQSSVNEGLCLSILEAMAAGRPVIATDVGGTDEVITDRKTGLLIPPGSSAAIGAAITDLLDHHEKRSELSRAGRSHVIEHFGAQRMVEAYAQLYEVLASRK